MRHSITFALHWFHAHFDPFRYPLIDRNSLTLTSQNMILKLKFNIAFILCEHSRPNTQIHCKYLTQNGCCLGVSRDAQHLCIERTVAERSEGAATNSAKTERPHRLHQSKNSKLGRPRHSKLRKGAVYILPGARQSYAWVKLQFGHLRTVGLRQP